MRNLWRNYGLSIALGVLFVLSLAGQWWIGWHHEINEAEAHWQEPSAQAYVLREGNEMLANWQSEFLQLFTAVLFTASLYHRGSPQSKDGDEEMKRELSEIRDQLKLVRAEVEVVGKSIKPSP